MLPRSGNCQVGVIKAFNYTLIYLVGLLYIDNLYFEQTRRAYKEKYVIFGDNTGPVLQIPVQKERTAKSLFYNNDVLRKLEKKIIKPLSGNSL